VANGAFVLTHPLVWFHAFIRFFTAKPVKLFVVSKCPHEVLMFLL